MYYLNFTNLYLCNHKDQNSPNVFRGLLKKISIIILALQILNLSIYNTEFYSFYSENQPRSQKELEEMNPVDCLSELVVEDMIGYENAFPETNHKSTKQRGELKRSNSIELFREDRFAKIEQAPLVHHSEYKKDFPLFRNNYSFLYYKEINHPPA